MAAGIALHREPDALVLAGATGLHLWRGPQEIRTLVAEHGGEMLFFNDILAAPGGRLYAGTKYWSDDGMEKPANCILSSRTERFAWWMKKSRCRTGWA